MKSDNHRLSTSLHSALNRVTIGENSIFIGQQLRALETEKDEGLDWGKYGPEHSDEEVTGHFGLEVHCLKNEDIANKVEQQVEKSAAVILLETGIGEKLDQIDAGSSGKGTRVRLLDMPVEEKLTTGINGVNVGDQIRVELIQINVKRECIDF